LRTDRHVPVSTALCPQCSIAQQGKEVPAVYGLKSKNDKIDAQGLARMGAEQCLALWQPMDSYFYQLRELTRQHQSLQELKTTVNNQLHAAELGMYQNNLVVSQLTALLTTLNGQLHDLAAAIEKHIDDKVEVKQKVDHICKIKG